jgi:hypothetical protein
LTFRRREPWPFVVVWRLALRETRDLTSTQYAIAHTIATYMRPAGWTGPARWHTPGRASIARGTKITTRGLDKNLHALADAGLLRILELGSARHLYAALVPDELADELINGGLVEPRDLERCERVGAALAGPGANEVLSQGGTRFSPLVNVVLPRGERGSPEVEVSSREDEVAALERRPDPGELAEIDRALRAAGLR